MDKSRQRSAQYGYFTGENFSWAFTNSIKVTATELLFSNSSVYIEIDKCLETGKQVIFPNINLTLMLNYAMFNEKYWSQEWQLFINSSMYIAIDTCVRTTGPLHAPKLFDFKLCLMRHTDHKNGSPSEARRSRFVITIYFTSEVQLNTGTEFCQLYCFTKKSTLFPKLLLWHHSAHVYHH